MTSEQLARAHGHAPASSTSPTTSTSSRASRGHAPRRRDRRLALQRRRHEPAARVGARRARPRGVDREHVTVMAVPGAFELPLGAMALAKTRRYACIVALGCVIRGETAHFDYVAARRPPASSSRRSRPAFPSRSACSPRTRSSRRWRGWTRAPRPCARALEMADLFHQLRADRRRPRSRFRYTAAADVEGLRNLREEARVREPPEPFDGGHEAPLRPEPPARPRAPGGKARGRTSARAASRPAKSRRPSSARPLASAALPSNPCGAT